MVVDNILSFANNIPTPVMTFAGSGALGLTTQRWIVSGTVTNTGSVTSLQIQITDQAQEQYC